MSNSKILPVYTPARQILYVNVCIAKTSVSVAKLTSYDKNEIQCLYATYSTYVTKTISV